MSSVNAISRHSRSTPVHEEQMAIEIAALADLDLDELRAR